MADLIAKQEEKKRKINIDDDSPFYVDIRKSLNDQGPGFCLAKWTQVTMHLQLGHTHSCHHPKTHQVPLRELKRNPTALHNTMYKKRRRKEMLEGQRPDECDYCWNVEDSSNRFSDRTFKSAENWSYPYMDEIKSLGWRDDYNPKYVEVSFSNACNFKCSYCGPAFSTKWMEEAEKFGAYPTTDGFNDLSYLKQEGKMPMPVTQANPYVDAFWRWWPDLSQVATAHLIRLIIIITLFPFIIVSLYPAETLELEKFDYMSQNHLDLILLLLVSLIFIFFFDKFRVPAALLSGTLVASGILQIFDIASYKLPDTSINFCLLILGASIGCRFANKTFKEIANNSFHGLVATILLVLLGLFAAYIATFFVDNNFLSLILSFCPGGIYEVAVIAIAFNLEPDFVAFHHIIRLLFILFIIPVILRLLEKTRIKN